MSAVENRPPNEYGEWRRGNAGQVGRCVTVHHWSEAFKNWMPMVVWEPHPDEPNDHKADCRCGSCELRRESQTAQPAQGEK
jgi:hypothetical protein